VYFRKRFIQRCFGRRIGCYGEGSHTMDYSDEDINRLQLKCKQIRRDIVNMIYTIQSGHAGGSLSMVEILVALYQKKLKVNPQRMPAAAIRKGSCRSFAM
jgi:hypothetical protein